MPSFNRASEEKLKTCHPDLQRLMREVVKHVDCTVICGYRGKEEQDKAVAEGKSKQAYPTSKHNSVPARAVDVLPYPLDWADTKRNCLFAGFVLGVAAQMGIRVRWGGDWNKDFKFNESFFDAPHFELIEDQSGAV